MIKNSCSQRFLHRVRNTLLGWNLCWDRQLTLISPLMRKILGNKGTIECFPWRIPLNLMKSVGTAWRGCSDKSVFWESQILCYIWVWSPDTGHGQRSGVPKGGTFEKQICISWAVRPGTLYLAISWCDLFLLTIFSAFSLSPSTARNGSLPRWSLQPLKQYQEGQYRHPCTSENYSSWIVSAPHSIGSSYFNLHTILCLSERRKKMLSSICLLPHVDCK